jgi:SpoVK/Ycf46/Vps4 family AAA+-type ATPase
MYIGQSERNLHSIFQKARQLKPCVLFFDEVDALGANRTDMRNSAGRHVINQFLSEMDGVEYDNEGILILAATNAPWHLDPAFRRPGRFDRIIFVPPPDEDAREAILTIKLKNKPIGKLNYDKIVSRSKEFSGADLEAVIDLAIESKLEESMRKGHPMPLETNDFLGALKKHRPTTKEWFQTAKNYALFANEAGLYDDILDYLKLKK